MKKILVVDNNRMFLRFLEKALTERGYVVSTADTGLEALSKMERDLPDILLADYVMPHIDGKTLCRIVRNNRRMDSVFIVLVSAVAAEDATDITVLDADAFVAKGPMDQMIQTIDYVINHPAEATERCRKGHVFGIDCVMSRDITSELLQSKQHLELILDRMTEGVMEIDNAGRIVYANPKAVLYTGRNLYDLLGSHLMDVFPQIRPDKIDRLLKTVEGGSENGPDLMFAIGDRLMELRAIPLDDEGSGYLAILDDVTPFKRLEGLLRQQKERYRILIDNVGAGILVAQGLKLVFVNAKLTEILDRSQSELLEESDPFSFIHPDDREMVFQNHVARIEGREAPAVYTFRLVPPGGGVLWVEAANVLIEWQGHPATLNFITDITERKTMELDRERLIAELQKALGQIKVMHGLLPICSSCKKIRDDKGDWVVIERYVADRSGAEFSHSICPSCRKKLYGEIGDKP
ncbi:MAG: PAS domain S-box protein [Desulfobacteraceae bacterium]|nr:PAS domain S-box protein [Desulfobacteraceae bacterium]